MAKLKFNRLVGAPEIELPELFEEVLVLVDGKRGSGWSNSYMLMAYRNVDRAGRSHWYEERHRERPIFGVVGWARVEKPDVNDFY